MATLAQIRAVVSRKTQDPDNTARSASVVDAEINRAIRYYSNKRFWFNEDVEDLTTVADTQTVTPSSNISHLSTNAFLLIDAQVKIDLEYLQPADFFERDQDQTGRPYYFTMRDNVYYLLPTPQQAYTIKFRYLKQYADLASDSDTNDFTNNAQDLIALHAIKNIYAEDKEAPDLAATYQQLEDLEFKALQNRNGMRLASGYVSNTTILQETYY